MHHEPARNFRTFPHSAGMHRSHRGHTIPERGVLPLCGSTDKVRRKKENNLVGIWNCHDCQKPVYVLYGTGYAGHAHTHAEVVCGHSHHGKRYIKSVSSPQLARDLGLNVKTAWYMQQRIRAAIASDQAPMFEGVVEADETYVGGKQKNTTSMTTTSLLMKARRKRPL